MPAKHNTTECVVLSGLKAYYHGIVDRLQAYKVLHIRMCYTMQGSNVLPITC